MGSRTLISSQRDWHTNNQPRIGATSSRACKSLSCLVTTDLGDTFPREPLLSSAWTGRCPITAHSYRVGDVGSCLWALAVRCKMGPTSTSDVCGRWTSSYLLGVSKLDTSKIDGQGIA